ATAQGTAREQLARGQAFWDQRLARSAIAALEEAANDPATTAEAHEALGRMYTFKGWQADNVYPGWHDEPSLREKALAELRAAVADRFIEENLSAYQLTGKSQGSFARGRATAVDLVGWALFLQKDYAKAKDKLEEAARLSQDQDFVNQLHLGELARAQNVPSRAREHYL